MKVLLAIPHVFPQRRVALFITNGSEAKPQAGGAPTSDDWQSQPAPTTALDSCLAGKSQPVVNREISSPDGVELTIQLIHPPTQAWRMLFQGSRSRTNGSWHERLQPGTTMCVTPLLEQAEDYDLVGYMEDDLVLTDPEFFAKILYLDRCSDGKYVFLPHRCEHIPGRGRDPLRRPRRRDGPICSGTPVKPSDSLATQESPLLRATNPHPAVIS